MKQLLFLLIFFFPLVVCAQMQGSEETTNKQIFKGTFIVQGDMNTYYPVLFQYGNQDVINHIRIYRSYGEAGPNALSPTHKGGLALEIDVNYGGWGGQTYNWRISDLRQMYHETFANASHAMFFMGFVVWLRGGGFQYHYESDRPANLQVCLNKELIYDAKDNYPDHKAYAPAPLTAPDQNSIKAHAPIQNENGLLAISNNNLGIGTDINRSLTNRLEVNGTIRCQEVLVESSTWPDYVFAKDYKLKGLHEVEAYIKANNHLPDMPAASDVEQNGVKLSELNTKLLQKVEELTLYIIELRKEVDELKRKDEKQRK